VRRVAILIGNSAFSPDSGFTQLRFPPEDVTALERILLDEKSGRYDRVIPLINKTQKEILREYNALLRDERGAEVLFYYSGHGKPSDLRKLFLAANDTTEDELLVTGVPFSTIIDLKENYGVGTFTAILDCCFAGLGSSDVKGSEDDELRAMGSGRGVFFLGAANATEVAKEDETLGHGVLTSAILEGLSSGLADKDNDGQVSGNDLFSWCSDYARRRGAQRVVMAGQAESREVIVAYSRRRIAPEVIERLRVNIATAFTQEWLPQQELDELKKYYLVPAVVVVPPAGSLADRFLAYTERRLTLREFLSAAEGPPPPAESRYPLTSEQRESITRVETDGPPLTRKKIDSEGKNVAARIYLIGIVSGSILPLIVTIGELYSPVGNFDRYFIFGVSSFSIIFGIIAAVLVARNMQRPVGHGVMLALTFAWLPCIAMLILFIYSIQVQFRVDDYLDKGIISAAIIAFVSSCLSVACLVIYSRSRVRR
jgi:Caspase domain